MGEGINGLLGYLVRIFFTKDISLVTTDGPYPTSNYHVIGFGGSFIKVPFTNDYEDPDALIKAAYETKAR